jgi:hypothetical protein
MLVFRLIILSGERTWRGTLRARRRGGEGAGCKIRDETAGRLLNARENGMRKRRVADSGPSLFI